MSRLRRANLAQRVVLVIAFADVLALGGSYIVSDGYSLRGGGWFAYTPLTDQAFYPDAGLAAFPRLLVWLGIILVWAVVSFWLLGLPSVFADVDDKQPS